MNAAGSSRPRPPQDPEAQSLVLPSGTTNWTLHRWMRIRVAPVLVLAVASLVINVLPALTQLLARYLHFDERTLGAFASASYLGSAAGAFAALALTKTISPRVAVLAGIGVLGAALLASAVLGQAVPLIFCAAVGGLGAGLASSACYYLFSLSEQERNTGASLLSQTALATLVLATIPALSAQGGWRWVFLGLGLLTLPCLLLAVKFPSTYEGTSKPRIAAAYPANKRLEYWALLSVVLGTVCMQMVWTYLGRMGSVAGLSDDVIARGLSLSTVAGFVGSALVLVCGERLGRTGALAPLVALTVIGIFTTGSPVAWIYVTGTSLYYFPLPIFIAAQFGAIVRRASSNRFALSYSVAAQIGGFGPAAGGFLAQRYGFGTLRLVSIGLMLASFLILWVGFLRHSDTPRNPPARS